MWLMKSRMWQMTRQKKFLKPENVTYTKKPCSDLQVFLLILFGWISGINQPGVKNSGKDWQGNCLPCLLDIVRQFVCREDSSKK